MPNGVETVEILEAIQSLATQMDARFSDVERRMATKEDLLAVKQDLLAVKQDLTGVKQDLLGVKQDIEHRMATKKDLKNFATKEDLQEFKSEIISHVDWFAAQHNRYDIELLALRSASLRHEERIEALEQK